ncbi:protein SCO1 homolog 1, mitochondrial-like isoform X3 [Miscanthus floridulus]|uniref:protein SCO1 homolog 1, mitochondrial-like isoform X3 n=1 Tax=Miscanthus floridulus TaxID=154761 RepID=UPI00345A4EE2
MRGRASHLRALLSRALSPSLPSRGRALPQVLGGSPPSLACVERWISARPCGSGAEMFGAGFLGRARFFSSDAAAATQGGSKPPAPAVAGSAGGEGGDDGQSGKSEQADAGKAVRGGPVSWLSFLLLLVTGGGIIVYYDKEKKRHIEELKNRTSAVRPGQSVGTAAIGGPFKLLNHDGKPVTEKDFMGKWTLFYFGFTHCPDICPDELQKMAAAIDKIKEKAKLDVVPVFITVDPERDTVEQVRDYVKEFHPDLIGLTGTTDEVRQVARAYRVYYMKTEEEGSDYLVDHSIVIPS